MIIHITDDISFDTEKSFDEQESECQTYFYDIMNNETPEVVKDDYNRPISETWKITAINYSIVRESVYQKREYDWHLQSQTIKIVENE